MSRLWDKGDPLDDLVLEFTVGQDHILDRRLVPYDVRATIAHATMLSEKGYLSTEQLASVRSGLELLAQEHAAGEWDIGLQDEDVHTALENRLVERIGEAGRRVHLGRSRNDQVLVALRLYLLDALTALGDLGKSVLLGLADVAEKQGSVPLPGYTHQQRAMPSTVALWAGGYVSEIEDDLQGLERARVRIDRNPLGSAAGYGVPVLDIDRARTTELLEFATTHEPVTAVQLSRGKAEAGVVFELSLLMQDLGRLAADLCLFATREFAFVELPARMTTGSSIMPQKRNPDVFELVRARAGWFSAWLQAIMGITAKMPSGYHRDLQLIKEPLFRAVDDAAAVLRVMAHAVPGIRFVEEHTRAAMDEDLSATERAYRLVQQEGIPFRDAYKRVARDLEAGSD